MISRRKMDQSPTARAKGTLVMDNSVQTQEVLVIPCSGIGKVHGLISREAVYHVTDNCCRARQIPSAWPCW